MRTSLPVATIAAASVMIALAASPAQATPTVSGGPLDAADFMADNITSGTFSYVGNHVADFSGSGSGVLTVTSATFRDTFGYTNSAYGNAVQVFSSSQSAPVVATISPTYAPFVFYFFSDGSSAGRGSDSDATLFSNGHSIGTDAGQTNLAIYESTTGEYAFFFDDGGPSGCINSYGTCLPSDDNDYNDLVVTYTPRPVPEPISLTILGTGILGLGLVRRHRMAV